MSGALWRFQSHHSLSRHQKYCPEKPASTGELEINILLDIAKDEQLDDELRNQARATINAMMLRKIAEVLLNLSGPHDNLIG